MTADSGDTRCIRAAPVRGTGIGVGVEMRQVIQL
jgi:hypothetical protein